MRRKQIIFHGVGLRKELKRRYTPRRCPKVVDYEWERRAKRVTLYAFYVDLGLTIEESKQLIDQAT